MVQYQLKQANPKRFKNVTPRIDSNLAPMPGSDNQQQTMESNRAPSRIMSEDPSLGMNPADQDDI
jgi:hypothetical protein